jgi:hypothetical protein
MEWTMKGWLFLVGTVALTSGFGVGCGSAGDSGSGDSGSEPKSDGGHEHDSGRDVETRDAQSDTSIDDAVAEGGMDAGPRCAATPTLLLPASSWASDAAAGTMTPSIQVADDAVFYVTNNQTGCTVTPPSPDSGPPVLPEGGCGGWTGGLFRIPVRGGSPTQLIAPTGEIASHFVVTKDGVVFAASTDKGKDPGGTAYLFRVPLKGGTMIKLATTSGLAGYVATDGTNAYFSDNDGIKSVPVKSGSVTTLTTDLVFSFAPIGSELILADFSNNRIGSVPLSGGSTTTVATAQLAPVYPLACGSSICWANAGNLSGAEADGGLPPREGALQKSTAGTTTNLSTSSSLFEPFAVVFDGDDFYTVAGSSGGDISRIPGNGGATTVLVSTLAANGLAIDESCVYWSDTFGGIYSLAKSASGPFSVK